MTDSPAGKPNVDPFSESDEAFHRISPQSIPPTLALAVTDKNLRNTLFPANQ